LGFRQRWKMMDHVRAAPACVGVRMTRMKLDEWGLRVGIGGWGLKVGVWGLGLQVWVFVFKGLGWRRAVKMCAGLNTGRQRAKSSGRSLRIN
jgi:hypothetical protein